MVEEERAGIWAGRVRVALSWPLLSPHPLPFQCRERGVAAFAGEMADDKGAGGGARRNRRLESRGGVRNNLKSKAENAEKRVLGTVFSVLTQPPHFQFSKASYLSFRPSARLSISLRGRSADNRRQGKKKFT